MNDQSPHDMQYRAGSIGLEGLGIASVTPHWFCSCGHWYFNARPMPMRKTGNNSIEARRSYAAHVDEVIT